MSMVFYFNLKKPPNYHFTFVKVVAPKGAFLFEEYIDQEGFN
jgi:hypothetical protein